MIKQNFLVLLFSIVGQCLYAQTTAVTLTSTKLFHSTNDLDTLHSQMIGVGTALNVLSISGTEKAIDHEGRVFYWYEVEDVLGRIGWLRGYDVAVSTPATHLSKEIQALSGRKLTYHRDFGQTKLWFATIETAGKELNDGSTFKELYLVLSNENGRALFHPVGIKTGLGFSKLLELHIQDVNSDAKPDLILLKKSQPEIGNVTYQLEILTINQGRLKHLFDKAITQTDMRGEISPIQASVVEIEENKIRFESIQYTLCPDSVDQTCIEFATYSFEWNQSAQKFQILFDPVTVPLKAEINCDLAILYPLPEKSKTTIGTLRNKQRLICTHMITKYAVVNQKKMRQIWFKVKTETGKTGYVSGECLSWPYAKQSALLHQWCTDPCLTIFDFKPNFTWIEIIAAQ